MTLAHVARSTKLYDPKVVDSIAEAERTLHSFDHSVSNLRFTNLCDQEFSPEQLHLLGLGLKFQPARSQSDDIERDIDEGFDRLSRKRKLESFFLYGESRDEDEIAPLERLATKSNWTPPDTDHFPSESLQRYLSNLNLVKQDLKFSVYQKPQRCSPVHANYQRVVRELRNMFNVVFIDSDKNQGLVALNRDVYVRACLARLRATHDVQLLNANDTLELARKILHSVVAKHEKVLNWWARKSLRSAAGMRTDHKSMNLHHEEFDNTTGSLAFAVHPRTHSHFRVPGFRCLWKIHKPKPDTRPITGNCCWILQPLSDVVDYYLIQHAKKCIDYCQDADFTIHSLQSTCAEQSDLLVGYDWTNLYPSFSHKLVHDKLNSFFSRMRIGTGLQDFLLDAVRIVLSYNYTEFNDRVYRQRLGFATGVSFGASLAHIVLYELTRDLFADYKDCIRFHHRYIDDGILIWGGSRTQLTDWFNNMNELAEGMSITYEVSESYLVFLDCLFYKGTQWRSSQSGRLDVTCYKKAINKYLYKPANSASPEHLLIAVAMAELHRLARRCSDPIRYKLEVYELYDNLRVRGYSPALLKRAFSRAPTWIERDQLIQRIVTRSLVQDETKPIIPLVLTFDDRLDSCSPIKAVRAAQRHLPPELDSSPEVMCWKAKRSLASSLVPFRFRTRQAV